MNEKTVTKAAYVEYLNELGTPEAEKRSNGGRVPDSAKYGNWMRRNDPIAFEVGFWDYYREKRNSHE